MASLPTTSLNSPITLLTKKDLPGAFRLEFHNKNDQVIAKLYQENVKRGTHSLEGVSAKQWEYELSTESIQDRIKQFLKTHHVPIEMENVTEEEAQKSLLTPRKTSSSSSSASSPSFSLTHSKAAEVDSLFQQILTADSTSNLRQSLLSALGSSYLDVRDSRGYTLLLAAVALGDQAKFDATLFLYKDQDALYATDSTGRNALHLAAAFGHTALIPKLIDEGFELNIKDQYGLMPLHWALHEGHMEAIQTFIESGASLVDAWVTRDGQKHYPIELAISAGNPAALDLLLKNSRLGQLDLTQPIQGRGTLLHLAIYADQALMLKHLLSLHAEKIKPLINHGDPQGRTPLQLAAYLGDEYAIYLLFRHGADLHYGIGENEGTAVHYAALGEQPAALELLYNLGAELERTNGKGQTPIVVLEGKYPEGKYSVSARKCKTLLARLPRVARVAQTEPPKYAKRPPFNLVLQGGGPRGMAYLGALEQMEKLSTLKELKRVAGISAGAITAAFLAVGCTTAELNVYLDQNLGRFLDATGELEGDLLAAAQSQSYQEAVRALLKGYWSSQSTVLPPFNRAIQLKEKLQQLTGLASGDAMRDWIEGIIREKTGKEHCTFKELKVLIDQEPKKYKELHIFSLCLIQGKQPQLIRFSHEDPIWDDLILSDAIRTSVSIPGVFQPRILYFKDATGTRHPREHYGQFIDGGLLCHNLLTTFDAEKYQEDRYFRGEKTNWRTLALSLRDETVHTKEELGTIASSPDLVKALVSTFYHAEHILMEETGRCKERTIEIPIQGVGLLNFPIATETKEKLVTAGREATDQFFSSSILAEPSPKPRESVQVTRDQGIPWRYSIFYEFQPKIEETPEEKLKALLSSTYTAKESLSIFRVKGDQEWEFKLPLEEMYVRLGIIERSEGKERDQTLDKHSTYLQDERIAIYETIFEPKKELKLEKLFEHESLQGKERKRVYIQGAAGSGKSILCHYIAYRWAKGDLWNSSFKYLFWIPLRNLSQERYPDAKTYTPIDLLVKEYEGEMDLRGFQTCLEQPELRYQTLIVLDGYDELSSDAERDTASLAKAFNELKEYFPHLLITSRPGSCPFERSCDLELLGFDRQGITEYIDKFFTQVRGEEKKKKLEEILKHSPHALSLARIPINLTLLCSLFCEDPTIFTSPSSLTMTFIYERIVNRFYQWFMLKRIDRGESKQTKEKILEEVDLRRNREVAAIATVLEEMAYFAMREDTLYLGRREIDDFRGSTMSSNELTDLGLLRLSEEKGYFIHLTFQEFLTASKVANHYLSGESGRDFVRSYKFNSRFTLVFYLIAGYLSLSAATNRRYKEALQVFFDDLFAEPHDLAISYELNLFAGCFEECQDPTQIKQYPIFIEVVTEYMTELTRLGLDFRLLDRRENLLSHPKVIVTIQHLLDDPTTVEKMLKIIERDGIAGRLASELIKSIVNLLNTSHAKSATAYALGKVAKQAPSLPKEAVEVIIHLLKEGDDWTRSSAVDALGAVAKQVTPFPKEALEALIQILIEGDNNAQSSAAYTLGKVAKQGTLLPKEALEALIQILIEGDNNAKKSAAYALEKVVRQGTPLAKEAVEALIQLLRKGNSAAKSSAADALGKVAQQGTPLPKEALEALIQILIEGKPIAKSSAAYALGAVIKQGIPLPKEVLEALIQILIEGKPIAKSSAAYALGAVIKQGTPLPKEALEALIQILIEGDNNAKKSAAYVLGKVAQQGTLLPKEALEALIQILIEGDNNAKKSAAYALGAVIKQGTPLPKEALEALIQILIEGNPIAQSSAADALGEFIKQGTSLPKEAVEALIQILNEGDSEAKRSAVQALGAVAKQRAPLPKEAVEPLIQIFKVGDSKAKSSAAYALGAVARQGVPLPKEVLEALILFLKEDYSFSSRNSAADALGAIAKQGSSLAKEVLKALIQILNEGNLAAKISAVYALGVVAQQGTPFPKEALEALILFLKGHNFYGKSFAVDALRAINKDTLLKMYTEVIPLIAEVCFFSDNSFSIQDKQFQISDQKTTYPSTVETKLCYEDIRENLPNTLAKWRKLLDGPSFSSMPVRDGPPVSLIEIMTNRLRKIAFFG